MIQIFLYLGILFFIGGTGLVQSTLGLILGFVCVCAVLYFSLLGLCKLVQTLEANETKEKDRLKLPHE